MDCRFCSVPMESHAGSGGLVRYYHCAKCQRWATNVYDEVYREAFRPPEHTPNREVGMESDGLMNPVQKRS